MQTHEDINTKQLELVELNEKVQRMKEKAAKSRVEAKDGFDKQVQALEDQMELFRVQLNKASMASGKAYTEVRGGLDNAWESIKHSFDSASKYIH